MLTAEIKATIREALTHFKEWVADLDSMAFYEDTNEGTQTLARIDAALAWLDTLAAGEQWTPVENGEYEFQNWDEKHTVNLSVARGDDGWTELRQQIEGYAGDDFTLPPDYALCRRTPAPQPTTQEDSNV